MIYVKSTSNKEYIIEGKRIPNVKATKYAEFTNGEWRGAEKIKVVQSLIKHNDILVATETPSSMKNPGEELKKALSAKTAENTKLQKELEELRTEALTAIAEKDKEIEALKKENASLQKKVEKKSE